MCVEQCWLTFKAAQQLKKWPTPKSFHGHMLGDSCCAFANDAMLAAFAHIIVSSPSPDAYVSRFAQANTLFPPLTAAR